MGAWLARLSCEEVKRPFCLKPQALTEGSLRTQGPLPLALAAGGDANIAKAQGEGAAAAIWEIKKGGRRFPGWSLKHIGAKQLLGEPRARAAVTRGGDGQLVLSSSQRKGGTQRDCFQVLSQYLVGIQRSLEIGTVFHVPTHKLKPHFQPSLKCARGKE